MKPARIVYCQLDNRLNVLRTKDPGYDPHVYKGPQYLDHDIDFTGTHYGWDLGKLRSDGASLRRDIFPTSNQVCMNNKDVETHHNTIAPRPWELIKLDVGYWGAYYRKRATGNENYSRDFGLVQGQDVYLCRFHSQCDAATKETFWADIDKLPPASGQAETAIRRLLTKLKLKLFAVELRSHALIPSSPLMEGLATNELKVFFPDLHLPERLPDEPATEDDEEAAQVSRVHPEETARKLLQARLVAAQHKPGWAQFNSLSTQDQTVIQIHIERLIVRKEQATYEIVHDRIGPWNTVYKFTRDQFLAELAHVERRIRAASSWFYEPAGDFTPPVKSGKVSLGDLVTMDHTEMDPSPAIDLINLLLELRALKAEGYKVDVYQAGDLFELWMGREFLYFDFPTIDAPLGGLAVKMLDTVSSHDKVAYIKDLGVGDDFQYRLDAGWRDSASPDIASGCKRFVFNEIRRPLLLQRHKSGWDYQRAGTLNTEAFYYEIGSTWISNHVMDANWSDTLHSMTTAKIGEGVIGRLQALHAQRCQNVLNHCLPETNAKEHGWGKLQAVGFMDRYIRSDASLTDDEFAWSAPRRVRQTEYHFNRAIVDLFDELGTTCIHGNHDGYRSDPLFAAHALGHSAQEYHTEKGIWMEHSHRYDRYNRDGRAIGAGMTNLVYYFMDELLKGDATVADWPGWFGLPYSQERTSFQPGAAQWFVTVNLAARGNADQGKVQGRSVEPFGLYVGGHTHGPDLVRIRFAEPK